MNLRRSIYLLAFFNLVVWGSVFMDLRRQDFSLNFFSVGQGDSEMMSSQGVNILIDGGPSGKVLSEVENVLGRNKYIDIMILTHPHADHYVGLAEVIGRYRVGALLLPEADSSDPAFLEFMNEITDRGITVVKIGEGDKISQGDTEIDILSPSGGDMKDMNARSVVMMIDHKGTKALLTGDIGTKEEARLVKKYDIDADILKVPHHGSNGSSSADFLREVSPKISVVELGEGNRYGFPKQEVLDRLGAVGSITYRTDTDGPLKVLLSEGDLRVVRLKAAP